MRLIFFLFLITQLLSFIDVFAEKVKVNSSQVNSIDWEKIEENKPFQMKKVIWRSYINDQTYFQEDNHKD